MVTGGWDYPQTALGDSLVYPENLSMSYVYLSSVMTSTITKSYAGERWPDGELELQGYSSTPALQHSSIQDVRQTPHLEMLKATTKFSFIVRKMNKFNQRGKLYRRLLR